MFAHVLAISATFAAVSSVLMAVLMFVRDMLTKPVEQERQRLTLFPQEPIGKLDRAFFHLVEEAGSEIDTSTWLLIIVATGILGAGLPLVLADSLLGKMTDQ